MLANVAGIPKGHIVETLSDIDDIDALFSKTEFSGAELPDASEEAPVEQALELDIPDDACILDLGTGTGAIALSLASERPKWHVRATDVYPHVVELASSNAIKNQLQQVEFICSAWFDAIPKSKYHLIVSNPPYIDPNDPHLEEGDVRFEPLSALVAENHGMADIEHIIQESKAYLHSMGWLMLEHGYQQAGAIQKLFSQSGYCHVRTIKDYGQQDRVTMGQFQINNQLV